MLTDSSLLGKHGCRGTRTSLATFRDQTQAAVVANVDISGLIDTEEAK